MRSILTCLLLVASLVASPVFAQELNGGLRCEPIEALADTLARLLPVVTGAVTETVTDAPAFGVLQGISDKETLAKIGVTLDGAIEFRIGGDDQMMLSLPLSSGADPEAVFDLLGFEERTVDGEGRWSLGSEEEPPSAQLVGEELRFLIGGSGEPPHGDLAATLVGLPNDHGCALAMEFGDELGGSGPVDLAGLRVFIPLRRADAPDRATFAFQVDMNGDGLGFETGQGTATVWMGTSTREPLITVTVGMPLLEFLEPHGVRTTLKVPIGGMELEAMAEVITVDGGSTVAMFDSPLGPQAGPAQWAAALPVRTPLGGPIKPPQLRAAMKEMADQGWAVTRHSGRSYTVSRDAHTLHLYLGRKSLFIGSDEEAVADAGAGRGAPWAGEAHVAQAAGFGLVGSVGSLGGVAPMLGPISEAYELVAAVRTIGPSLVAELDVYGPEASTFVLGAIAAIAIPNFLQVQRRARRSEVRANVDDLHTAQLVYLAEGNSALALPPAPRPTSELDGKGVEWTADPAWEEVGWAADGAVRGVYWVEIVEGGFEAHGMADIDGDGEPCHYMRAWSLSGPYEGEWVTGPTVF